MCQIEWHLVNQRCKYLLVYIILIQFLQKIPKQILRFLSCSSKDLGVLLCCYYLSLGYNAKLVLGHALPGGDTTFVLTQENDVYFLIDPSTGQKFNRTDIYCPLSKVYCLVSHENVNYLSIVTVHY